MTGELEITIKLSASEMETRVVIEGELYSSRVAFDQINGFKAFPDAVAADMKSLAALIADK